MRHPRHIAVRIVGIDLRIDGGRGVVRGAIILWVAQVAGAEESITVLRILIAARPAGMGRVGAPVDHLQDVAHLVVDIALAIPPHGVAVAGVQQSDPRRIGRARRRRWQQTAAVLSQVLPAGRLDQAVEGVVGVVVARLDAAVAEEDGLLGVVADVGDVAGRVSVDQPGSPGGCGSRWKGSR